MQPFFTCLVESLVVCSCCLYALSVVSTNVSGLFVGDGMALLLLTAAAV